MQICIFENLVITLTSLKQSAITIPCLSGVKVPLIGTSVSWQPWVMSFSDAEYQAMIEPSDHENMVFDRSLGRRTSTNEEAIIQGEELPTTTVNMGQSFPDQEKSSMRSTLFGVAGYIIIMEFCERLAYYGFAGSLVLLFESELGMTNEVADSQFALWSGMCYVMPLLGGWVADSYLGRYHSIVVFSVFYLVGLFLATGSCIPGCVSQPLLFLAMYLLALGTGGIKSSVSVFGADQFDDNNPRDVQEKLSFFNWFYWSINLGALVSFTLVSYVCQYGLPFLGGSDWGFMVGYSIPCIAMTLALALFLFGSHKYRRFPPSGSVMSRAVGLVFEAAWSRRGAVGQLGGIAGGEGSGVAEEVGEGRPKWLQRASERMGGSYAHDEVAAVSRVWRLLPFLALQVPYYAVYAQMSTAFQNQGCQMDLSIFGFDIPVATLNMFDTLAVLCLIPVVDRGVYPWLRRLGYEPTKLRKIGAGLILVGLAVLVAAWVEVARRGSVEDGEGSVLSPCQREGDYDPEEFQQFWRHRGESESYHRPVYCHKVPGCDELGPDGLLLMECIDCETPPLSSSVSIMWQIPQYILIGASEILSIVTSLEFFYDEAPTTMRGVSAGLNLLTTALGSWVTIPLLRLVNSGAFGAPWVPHDLNKGYLEVYFCLLAGLVLVSFILFVIVARGYHYKSPSGVSAGYSSITDDHFIENGAKGSTGGSGGTRKILQVSELDSPGDGSGGSGQAFEEDRTLLPQNQRGRSGGRSGSPAFGEI